MLEGLEQFARVAPALLVPVTAVGVLVTAAGILISLYVGVSTLREVRRGRQLSIQPFCLFATGAQKIAVELSDANGIPGIDLAMASQLTKNKPAGENRVDVKNHWGRLRNYGLGPALNTRISVMSYRVFIDDQVFTIDDTKRKDFPYNERLNSIPASPSHLAVGQEAEFRRLPTPIVVDYKRRISRLDCVVKIIYEDVYANAYSKFQGLRVFCDQISDSSDPAIILTFLEEIDPANPDFSIFGPPQSGPVAFPGFRDINPPPDIGAP